MEMTGWKSLGDVLVSTHPFKLTEITQTIKLKGGLVRRFLEKIAKEQMY